MAAEVIVLALRDHRIPALIKSRVGRGPLADYLLEAILANHGTLMVARLILDALQSHISNALSVSWKDVKTLGVHFAEEERIGEITRRISIQVPDLPDRFYRLHVQLKYDPSSIPEGVITLPCYGVRPRFGVSQDVTDIIRYTRIYLCAFAMLVGCAAANSKKDHTGSDERTRGQ